MFAIQDEKLIKMENVIVEKNENILQLQLAIKEWENLFEKKIEMINQNAAEKNKEILSKHQKEIEIMLKVFLFIVKKTFIYYKQIKFRKKSIITLEE